MTALAHTPNMLRVVVIDRAQGFADLEEEWEELYLNSPLATPFQSWAWLYSWWESYGEDYQLRLITVRDEDDLLVGIVPLMLERRWGLRRLLFVGTGLTDYHDVLARRGWEELVAEAGRRALRKMGGWDVADLQQLRPGAAAWGIFEHWDGPGARIWQGTCIDLATKPWEELLASVSSKLRNTVRRTLRRAEADGVRPELADAKEAKQAARRLVALHRESWRGRAIAQEHLSRRFEAHLEAAASRMTASGVGVISEFWRDGEVIVSHFMLFGKGFTDGYIVGTSQEALRRYQVFSLIIENALNIARNRGSECMGLGRGEERYKVRWSSRVVPNWRLVLSRGSPSWVAYAGYHSLYSRARQYSKSERAPRWATLLLQGLAAIRRLLALVSGSSVIAHVFEQLTSSCSVSQSLTDFI